MESIGQKIRSLRQQKELSMDQLAIMIGVTRSQVSLYELGHSSPNAIMVEKLAKALDVHPAYFFVDQSEPGQTPDKLELRMIALQKENDQLRAKEKALDAELRSLKDDLLDALKERFGFKTKGDKE